MGCSPTTVERHRLVGKFLAIQYDGAPVWRSSHCLIGAQCYIMYQHFPGSLASPAPLTWPPRSSDLTISDNSLWTSLKDKCQLWSYNKEDFQRAVEGLSASNHNQRNFASDDAQRGVGVESDCAAIRTVNMRIHLSCNQGWKKNIYFFNITVIIIFDFFNYNFFNFRLNLIRLTIAFQLLCTL